MHQELLFAFYMSIIEVFGTNVEQLLQEQTNTFYIVLLLLKKIALYYLFTYYL